MLQRQPVQKLHGDERFAVLVVNFVDGADVRMIQGRGSLGFALEAAECLRVFGYVVRQELKGDEATEFDILGLVDHTHPAATELLDDAVVRDRLPHKLGGRNHWRDVRSDRREGQSQCSCGQALLQLRVLRLGFFQDGEVGVRVLPEREKIF